MPRGNPGLGFYLPTVFLQDFRWLALFFSEYRIDAAWDRGSLVAQSQQGML